MCGIKTVASLLNLLHLPTARRSFCSLHTNTLLVPRLLSVQGPALCLPAVWDKLSLSPTQRPAQAPVTGAEEAGAWRAVSALGWWAGSQATLLSIGRNWGFLSWSASSQEPSLGCAAATPLTSSGLEPDRAGQLGCGHPNQDGQMLSTHSKLL